MSLRIPNRYRSGLSDLALLSDSAYAQISQVLPTLPQSQNGRSLAEAAAPKLEELDKERLNRIFDALTSIFRLRVRSGKSVEQVASDVMTAFEINASEPEKNSADLLRRRLNELLNVKTLDVFEPKAIEMQEEFERLLFDAKLFTDIRPIFGDSIDELPRSLIVTHTMKLLIRDKGLAVDEPREIFFALDAKDISDLIEMLQRARSKEASLNRLLATTGTPVLDLSE